jgi:hypothetical protein
VQFCPTYEYTKFHYFLRFLKVIYYRDIAHIKHSQLLQNTVLQKFILKIVYEHLIIPFQGQWHEILNILPLIDPI